MWRWGRDPESVPACCPPMVGAGKPFGAEKKLPRTCTALWALPRRVCAAVVVQVYQSQGRCGEG